MNCQAPLPEPNWDGYFGGNSDPIDETTEASEHFPWWGVLFGVGLVLLFAGLTAWVAVGWFS